MELGCKSVLEDIEQELLQLNGHSLGWGMFRCLQRLNDIDGHSFWTWWLERLLAIGRFVPRGYTVHCAIVHEQAASTTGGEFVEAKLESG